MIFWLPAIRYRLSGLAECLIAGSGELIANNKHFPPNDKHFPLSDTCQFFEMAFA